MLLLNKAETAAKRRHLSGNFFRLGRNWQIREQPCPVGDVLSVIAWLVPLCRVQTHYLTN